MSDLSKLACLLEEMEVVWDYDGDYLTAAGRRFKTNKEGQIIEVEECK